MSNYLRTTTRRQRFEMTCAVGIGLALLANLGLSVHALATDDHKPIVVTRTVQAAPVTKVVTKVKHTLPECAQEDSRNCIWHADESGNGQGVTFVDVDGTAYYAEGTLPANASDTAKNLAKITHSTLGDLLVCDDGLEVSTDVAPDGTPWAACM